MTALTRLWSGFLPVLPQGRPSVCVSTRTQNHLLGVPFQAYERKERERQNWRENLGAREEEKEGGKAMRRRREGGKEGMRKEGRKEKEDHKEKHLLNYLIPPHTGIWSFLASFIALVKEQPFCLVYATRVDLPGHIPLAVTSPSRSPAALSRLLQCSFPTVSPYHGSDWGALLCGTDGLNCHHPNWSILSLGLRKGRQQNNKNKTKQEAKPLG